MCERQLSSSSLQGLQTESRSCTSGGTKGGHRSGWLGSQLIFFVFCYFAKLIVHFHNDLI